MLSIEQALERCLGTVPPVSTEEVALHDAYGRILAEDVHAVSPLPPWDNSAMDGFAVRAADTADANSGDGDIDPCAEQEVSSAGGPWLDITETIPAGQVGQKTIGPGQAARIMTGAPVPEGTTAIVMREHATAAADRVQIHQAAAAGAHIRRRGEDVQAGQLVLSKGQTLSPSAVGLAASVGRSHLTVAVRPTVGIVATGDELVADGKPLGPGQIYSSNTAALVGLVRAAGAIAIDCGIAPDTLDGTRAAFERASAADLIISTGGVSVGDFDVVKDAMAELGAEMQFWKVRMKPGKPLALGIIGSTPAFGLPGNPVSAQVGFLQFVRPWIQAAMGSTEPYLPVIEAQIAHSYTKRPGRAELVRVVLQQGPDGWTVRTTGGQGSGSQTSMAAADGLMMVDVDTAEILAGDTVRVQLIRAAHRGAQVPGLPG